MDKLTPSDRVVIYNAARQVVYRGYAANAVHGTLNPQRRIKKMGLGMETYRATEQMWDWEKTDSLPEQVPVEQRWNCNGLHGPHIEKDGAILQHHEACRSI